MLFLTASHHHSIQSMLVFLKAQSLDPHFFWYSLMIFLITFYRSWVYVLMILLYTHLMKAHLLNGIGWRWLLILRFQEVSGALRIFQDLPGAFRSFQELSGGFRRFQEVSGGFRRFQEFCEKPVVNSDLRSITEWGDKCLVTFNVTKTKLFMLTWGPFPEWGWIIRSWEF